jgi:tetratricopeptide (TPR) repeat protein
LLHPIRATFLARLSLEPRQCLVRLRHRVTWTIEGRRTSHRALFPAWGLIGISLSVLALVGWIALASAVWYHTNRIRGFHTVTWTDVALPWRWDERREKQGKILLGSVEGLFKERKYREGLFALQVGLRMVPGDLAARRTFAGIQHQLGRDDLAAQLLADGLHYAFSDPEFARLALTANLEAEAFERVLEMADAWLAQPARATEADADFHTARAQALGFLGRPEEALACLESGGVADSAVAALTRAQIQWVNGRVDAALSLLSQAAASHPENDLLRLRLIQYAGASGRDDLAEQTLLARIEAEPRNAARVLDLLRWQADNGRQEAFERGLAVHVQRAANSEAILLDIAKLLARLGRVSDMDALPGNLAASEASGSLFALARIDALIVSRRFPEARADLEQWRARWREKHPRQTIDTQVAEALILHGLGLAGEAEIALAKVLESEQLGPRGFTIVADRFTALGQPTIALRILRRALEIAPGDSSLLRSTASTAAAAGDWAAFSEAIDRILARRHVDPALLAGLASHLRSDLSLFVPGRAALLERMEAAAR